VKVAVVVGPRPEAIKLAPTILALKDPVVMTTGQHEVGAALCSFGIEADYAFPCHDPLPDIVRNLTAAIRHAKPDVVLVEGDTTSTLGGALVGYLEGIPVAHQEAGLRSGDLSCPWPEEGWRMAVSRLASYHFAPTTANVANLLDEGVAGCVYHTGNTSIDALRFIGARKTSGGPDIVVELHRRESIGEPLHRALQAVRRLAHTYDVKVLCHPNPAVRSIVREHFPDACDGLPYREFVSLIGSARLVLSDSGGLQEECSYLGVPMLVAREKTERHEAVECGASVLVGTDGDLIEKTAHRLLTDCGEYDRMANAGCPFGDGHAAERIAEVFDG
jgi:UDP-N-acetylglucosamine 2-epimerase (non-hydrolysing)